MKKAVINKIMISNLIDYENIIFFAGNPGSPATPPDKLVFRLYLDKV